MSHSYRHTPIFGNAGSRSSKWYKTHIRQTERARVRTALAHGDWEAASVEMAPWNSWDDPRDGKRYQSNFYPHQGWGIHLMTRWYRNWNKEDADRRFCRAMRK